jgi:hypothetical protein
MDEITAIFVYKVLGLLVGTFITWLGFRLFTTGVFKSSGNIDAMFNQTKIVLRRAAPGTLFLIFGASVTVATIWKGLELSGRERIATTSSSVEGEKPQPPPNTETGKVASALPNSGGQVYEKDISASGFGSAARLQDQLLAQAVNTIALAGENNSTRSRQDRTAIAMLLEWRKEVARKYGYTEADFKLYASKEETDFEKDSSLSDAQKTTLRNMSLWLKKTLE